MWETSASGVYQRYGYIGYGSLTKRLYRFVRVLSVSSINVRRGPANTICELAETGIGLPSSDGLDYNYGFRSLGASLPVLDLHPY